MPWENALYIGDLRQSVPASRIDRKTIEVEADYGVASPFPPKSEHLVKDVSFDWVCGKMDHGRDHFHLTAQSPYSIGERANSHVAAAPLLNILRYGSYEGEAAIHTALLFERIRLSASPGCSCG